MRRIAVVLLALLLCLPACAEGFLRSGEGGTVGDRIYVVLPSGSGSALICLREGTIYAAEQADEIGSIISDGECLRYLRRTGDVWEIVRRDVYRTEAVFTFEPGEQVSGLCMAGQNLFVLRDERLCIVYPESGLCLQMANVCMESCVIEGDYAYYISREHRSTHTLTDLEGNSAQAEAGQLWRLNLSTAAESCVLEEGIRDLTMYGGVLYFHDLADACLCGTGEGCTLEGRLWSIDLSTGVKHRMTDGYDWGYLPAGDEVLLLREEGLVDAESGELVSAAEPGVRLLSAGETAVLFEGDPFGFTVVDREGNQTGFEK